MRQPIVGMSLKNYINLASETNKLCKEIAALCGHEEIVEQFLFPSLGTIEAAINALKGTTISVGAQNISPYARGAYTGEYSIETLQESGGEYCEIAHYERKTIFKETNEMIHQKIELCLSNSIFPVVCIGEEKFDNDSFEELITQQLTEYFHGIDDSLISKAILAYEPGWAIGQAEAASADYIHQAHTTIRKILQNLFGQPVAEKIRMIYGGSVSKMNCQAIVSHAEVDGVFLGRFGHVPADYKAIVDVVKQAKAEG